MEKHALNEINDRKLLEFILCNQVYLERRLERIENCLQAQDKEYYGRVGNSDHLTGNFDNLANKFKGTKTMLKQHLKENPVDL